MAKSLLTLLECPHKPCQHSQMVYKLTKLCDDHKACPFKKKHSRQQKAEKLA